MDIFDEKGISPMLISEQVEPYDDPDTVFEIKIDGIRALAYCSRDNVDIRNKRDVKLVPRFPELKDIFRNCKEKCILDGEVNIMVNGKPDFYEVQRRTLLTDPFKIELAADRYPANFIVYDIIYYKDHLVTELPLLERKQLIEDIIIENDYITRSRHIDTYGKALFEMTEKENLEGIVGKKKESLYWFGKRSKDWKKVKVMKDEDFACLGYIRKPNNMTSLILAKYDKSDNLIITNHVTLGVSLSKLYQHNIVETDCPLSEIPKGNENAVWIKPVVCTVEYMPSEKIGFRQAVFKAIRDDKRPEECRI